MSNTTSTGHGAALVLRADGEVREIDLSQAPDTLAVMYEQLDCRAVDVVRLTEQIDMWVDDEGIFAGGINVAATLLARRYGFTWQPYFGHVLLCGVNGAGDSVNLTVDQVRAVTAAFSDIAAELD